MGRLIGIPHFFTAEAYEEEKQDTRDLRQAACEPESVKLLQVQIAQRMHETCKGHIIRRTAKSLNWKGEPLVALPPCHIIQAFLDLTEREANIINNSLSDLQDEYVSLHMFDIF